MSDEKQNEEEEKGPSLTDEHYFRYRVKKVMQFENYRRYLGAAIKGLIRVAVFAFLVGLVQFINFFFIQRSEFYLCENRGESSITKEYMRFVPSFFSLTGQCTIRHFKGGKFKKVMVKDSIYCEDRLSGYKAAKLGHCRLMKND